MWHHQMVAGQVGAELPASFHLRQQVFGCTAGCCGWVIIMVVFCPYRVCPPYVGLTSPQLKSAGGPRPGTAHRDSCLVLPSSPMAPAAAGRPASPAAWQIHSTLSTPVPTRTASPGPPEAAATEPVHAASLLAQPAQTGAVVGAASLSKAVSSAGVDEYNYIK